MKQKNLVALLLAGGVGKRFWPITAGKSVFRFFGRTVIEHSLESLRIAGVTSAIIVTNPEDANVVRSLEIPGMSLEIVVQERPVGMADGVLAAKNVIGHRSCLIMNAADVVDDALYEGLLKEIDDQDALVVGKRVSSHFSGGYLTVKNDRLINITEKPEAGREPSDLVNVVFHYFPDPAEFIRTILVTQSTNDDIYEKALSSYAANHTVRVVAYTGPWQPIKYPWHILDVMDLFMGSIESHKGKNVVIKDNVVIEGQVYIEDNVKIFENTKIVGRCYIGRNTVIGNNCILRKSHIGTDCVVGFNCDVTRSYIGDSCWLHSNYIGDSVLEGNISMGSGATLANLRLDDGEISSVVSAKKISTGRNKLGAMIGHGVRIGVNASIMPGVKIGKNSFIGSGVVLDRDLSENSFCIAKPGFTITKNIKNAPSSRESFKKKI
jgi:UDP-N-acetylglucosamine diphosphorylase / glucose-1-phosphate thymidylyltransferase / UDP-N-acetylgalactosamine diphosphorylase / glucosamine-1-phosphate N-acetyltransferase / galactosamine-1-phosphate N-acetyltransferase